jgi:glycosyltransferase involved in cell wall biosynthesis
MKKILVLGGAFNEVRNFRMSMITQLVDSNFAVYVFALDYTEDDKFLIKSIGAIPVSYPGKRGGLNPFREIYNIFKLFIAIKKISPDFIFSYFTKQVIIAGLIARLIPVKASIGLIEGLGYGFGDNFGMLSARLKRFAVKIIQISLYNLSLRSHSKVLFLNGDDPVDLARYLMFKPNNFEIVGPIGVNLAMLKPLPLPSFDIFRFIFVGRLIYEKGILQFIEAAALVKGKYPNTEFVVLGGLDSDNPDCIDRKVLDDAVDSKVIVYPGHVRDPQKWISDSHVFVLPSYYREGFPRSSQEAMALGRTVISTTTVGCRESVIDGFDGYLVPPRSVSSLVDKITYFIENPNVIQAFGGNARSSAETRFDEIIFNGKVIRYFNYESS